MLSGSETDTKQPPNKDIQTDIYMLIHRQVSELKDKWSVDQGC